MLTASNFKLSWEARSCVSKVFFSTEHKMSEIVKEMAEEGVEKTIEEEKSQANVFGVAPKFICTAIGRKGRMMENAAYDYIYGRHLVCLVDYFFKDILPQ